MIKVGDLYRNIKDNSITFLVDDDDPYDDSVYGYLKNGVSKSFSKKYFNKNFVHEQIDYSVLDKHIMQYITTVPELSSIRDQICRRLHPGGYFHVGDIVFGTENIGYYSSKPYDFRHIQYPMKIIEITLAVDSSTVYIIRMEPVYDCNPENYNKDLYMPMYQDRYSKIDAYACLRRYDLPY